jgi:hypothetical protein
MALRRRVGTPALMRGQLQYLLDICDRPAVSIQVCPFLTGASYAAPGSFSILQFATDDLSDIVYVEQLTSALYLDKRAEVHQYTTAMDQIAATSLTPDQTTDLIRSMLGGIPD